LPVKLVELIDTLPDFTRIAPAASPPFPPGAFTPAPPFPPVPRLPLKLERTTVNDPPVTTTPPPAYPPRPDPPPDEGSDPRPPIAVLAITRSLSSVSAPPDNSTPPPAPLVSVAPVPSTPEPRPADIVRLRSVTLPEITRMSVTWPWPFSVILAPPTWPSTVTSRVNGSGPASRTVPPASPGANTTVSPAPAPTRTMRRVPGLPSSSRLVTVSVVIGAASQNIPGDARMRARGAATARAC
jgi:hypothetical protein